MPYFPAGAAAASITGTTLASNVVTSSLTTVGALGTGSINWSGAISTSGLVNFTNKQTNTVTDTSIGLLVAGTSKAVRIIPSSSDTILEGVDNTGVASFQPLVIGGSYVSTKVSGTEYMRVAAAGAIRMNAYGVGTLTSDSSGNITSVSDGSLKERVADFTRSLDDLKKAGSAVVFDWNEESGLTGRQAGWMLERDKGMAAAIPEAVGESPAGHLTFSDRPVIAACVNALLELDARLAKLEI